jgi:hypothetical protein
MYHGFVKQYRHNATVQDVLESLKLLRRDEFGAKPPVFEKGKIKLHPILVAFAAGETHPVIEEVHGSLPSLDGDKWSFQIRVNPTGFNFRGNLK